MKITITESQARLLKEFEYTQYDDDSSDEKHFQSLLSPSNLVDWSNLPIPDDSNDWEMDDTDTLFIDYSIKFNTNEYGYDISGKFNKLVGSITVSKYKTGEKKEFDLTGYQIHMRGNPFDESKFNTKNLNFYLDFKEKTITF